LRGGYALPIIRKLAQQRATKMSIIAARGRSTCSVLVTAMALSLSAAAGPYDPVPMNGADVTAHDVAVTLFKAKAGAPVDYSYRKLMYLDLSGLDFKGARFTQPTFTAPTSPERT
jgi:hypothetical protein